MKNKYFLMITLLITLLIGSFTKLIAQCTFTGLNAVYCTNSPTSSLTPGLTVQGGTFSGPGVLNNIFNPAVAGPGTHTINYATCTPSYAVSSTSFAPGSALGTGVNLTDDSESGALPIGFNFRFFCVNYTNFYISSNGFIEFSLTGSGCCSGQALPNNTTPNNLIAGCWNDLNPGNGGTITYSTIGTAPSRTLLVSFVGVPYFSNTPGVTFQIKLFETTNIIEIHSTSINNANSNSQTMGIENVGGTVGFPVTGRNGTTWTATNDAYRWTPSTACNVSQVTTVSPSTISVIGTNSICIGGTASLTALGNTTYTWSTNVNTNSITATPVVNTTYSVAGTNSFGCVANSAITVTVDNTPTVTAVSSNTTNGSCPNSPLVLSGNGAFTYSWTNNVSNGVVFTPTVTNTYSVTGFNACGSATAAISVSIHPIPPVTGSANNPTICSGSPVTLNGGGTPTFTWTGPSGQIANNTAFFPSSTANYTVIGTSALGCTASAVAGVSVFITPTITPVVTPTAICFGSTATLSAIGATGYTWTPGTALNSASVTIIPPTSTTYTLVRRNGACVSTSTVLITVNPIPSIIASASPSQICVGQPVVMNVFGGITYTWEPSNFSAANFTLFPNSSTIYTVTGTNGSCTASAPVSVSVNPSPAINILTPTLSICQGSSITFTASGAPSFTWLPSGINTSTITVSPNATSQYTVLGGNSFNCVVPQTQLVIVNPTPVINLTSSIPYICAGDVAVLSVTPVAPGVLYTWNNTTVPGPNVTVNPLVTTTYFATGTNNSTGCTNTNSITLSVYISTFVVSSPTAICKGNVATLSASGAANSYSWTTPGSPATPVVTVSPQSNTTYFVTGITGSCTTTQSVTLIVNPIPNVNATSLKLQICRLEVGTVTATGANSYTWNTGVVNQSISYSTLTITTTFTVTGQDLNGCVKTATVSQFVATCLGVDNISNEGKSIKVYPNPNNGNFVVTSDVEMTVNLINALGQVIKTIDLSNKNKNEITVNNLPAGIYFITGETNGFKVNKKIVVEH